MTSKTLAVAAAITFVSASVQIASAQDTPAPAAPAEGPAVVAGSVSDAQAPAAATTGPASDAAPSTEAPAAAATEAAAETEAPAAAETAAPAAAAGENGVLASGSHTGGVATAELTGAILDGDRVTVKVRFIPPAGEDGSGAMNSTSTHVYTGLDSVYEEIYLLAGDKKYMLLKDKEGKALGTHELVLKGVSGGTMFATWYGVFPAPPQDASVTLYMPDVEPLGPFRMQQ